MLFVGTFWRWPAIIARRSHTIGSPPVGRQAFPSGITLLRKELASASMQHRKKLNGKTLPITCSEFLDFLPAERTTEDRNIIEQANVVHTQPERRIGDIRFERFSDTGRGTLQFAVEVQFRFALYRRQGPS